MDGDADVCVVRRTFIHVGSYDARLVNVNDCGSLQINIPPPLNYKTNLIYFYKSGQIAVTLVKTLLTKICNSDWSQNVIA
jgi:hypothetical protein